MGLPVDLNFGLQRHINGVVSNGVVPKSQICKLVAKPAPDIFRIQGVYHNEAQFQMTCVSNSCAN